MVKIISRQSLGQQKVYDIGVEKDHNFLLSNNLIASNCFNKSHSTAYAYVTYQTAYLKANYPVEYMTALLSASSGNKEKIARYQENCQKMNIAIKPPDINLSEVDFTPLENSILYGLSAVQNLGEGAIECILSARNQEQGKFISLPDICSRIDLRVVNRRALETLILCGALDQLHPNRHQMIKDLDLIIGWAHNKAKDKETGQTNLFDLFNNNSQTQDKNEDTINFDDVPSAPAVVDYTLEEKLKNEKELLGFYVSEHPLKTIYNSARLLSPINLNQLEEQKVRSRVSTVVILNAVKKITTKNGDQMAFITLEDISGEAEGVVFPSVYEALEPLLIEDNRLIVWAKVDKRDEKMQLIVEDLEVVENVQMVMIELSYQQATNPSHIENLKQILREQSDKKNAKVPIIIILRSADHPHFIRFGREFWVTNAHNTVNYLQRVGFRAYTTPLVKDNSPIS
jgi:DNA polymerase III subunit alpha